MINEFIIRRPDKPSFSRGETALGFSFPINNPKIEIDYIDSIAGHNGTVISETLCHYYYIIEGEGDFIIDGTPYPVIPGQLIQIPPKHSFDYKGKMKMLLVMEPPFNPSAIIEL